MEEQLKAVCVNPWCKATFYYKEEDMIVKTKNNGFAQTAFNCSSINVLFLNIY
jgi:hypothetical protein